MSDRGVACTMERIEIEYEYQPANNKEKHQCASSTKENDRKEVGPQRRTGMGVRTKEMIRYQIRSDHIIGSSISYVSCVVD